MALYIPQSILHLARSLYVRPETYGPTYVYVVESMVDVLLLAIQEFDFLVDSEPDGTTCSLLVLWFLSVNLLAPELFFLNFSTPCI